MKKKTRRQITITAVAIFVLGSFVPSSSMGCLHHARLEMGLPVPWLGIDVRYGKPRPTADFFAPGRIERIQAIHVYWTVLPFAVAGSIVLASMFVGIGKGVAGMVHLVTRRKPEGTPNQASHATAKPAQSAASSSPQG